MGRNGGLKTRNLFRLPISHKKSAAGEMGQMDGVEEVKGRDEEEDLVDCFLSPFPT